MGSVTILYHIVSVMISSRIFYDVLYFFRQWVVFTMNPLMFLDKMMTSSNGNIFRVTGHLCGEFTGPGEFPTQKPVTRSFDVFFDLCLNKRLNKQPWGW